MKTITKLNTNSIIENNQTTVGKLIEYLSRFDKNDIITFDENEEQFLFNVNEKYLFGIKLVWD